MNSNDATDVKKQPKDSFGEVIGSAFWLAAKSEEHRQLAFGTLADAIMSGIDTRQFRLWRRDGAPLAFVSWALLDAENEARFRAGEKLEKEELASGGQAWVIVAISPFLPTEVILKDLRETQFKGKSLMAMV